jgi:5-methylcytosine-specific restriction protein A
MPRTPIPTNITHEDVLSAISALAARSVSHEFLDSERYDLVHGGNRYAPKAVFGVAAQRVVGRVLKPSDFSGGESSTCHRVLRKLGFTIEEKPDSPAPARISFVVGKEYNRRTHIHNVFGGQNSGGIATPAKHPVVFLFTGSAGESFGYEDRFREDGVFLYTGEGQSGDMTWQRGNLAIRESLNDGKQLLVFEQTRKGFVRFFGFARYIGHHSEQRPDKDGKLRIAFVFELEISGQEGPPAPTEADAPAESEVQLTLPTPRSRAELRAAALLHAGKKPFPEAASGCRLLSL